MSKSITEQPSVPAQKQASEVVQFSFGEFLTRPKGWDKTAWDLPRLKNRRLAPKPLTERRVLVVRN